MENKQFYFGIDIGTTSIKAALFDKAGERIALRHYEYALDTDAATGFIEYDPEGYVADCERAIAELRAAAEEAGGTVAALSVDTQGETLILADEAGRALAPAVVWLDNRAQKQADAIKARFGNKLVYEVTGQPEIPAGFPASKLLWFKENRPEVWAKTRKVFLLEDWILFRLTGEFVTEPTIQSSSLYFDIRSGCWWKEMLDFLGVPEKILPRVAATGTPVGEYRGIRVMTSTLR